MDSAARKRGRRQETPGNQGRQEAVHAGPHGGGAPDMHDVING